MSCRIFTGKIDNGYLAYSNFVSCAGWLGRQNGLLMPGQTLSVTLAHADFLLWQQVIHDNLTQRSEEFLSSPGSGCNLVDQSNQPFSATWRISKARLTLNPCMPILTSANGDKKRPRNNALV